MIVQRAIQRNHPALPASDFLVASSMLGLSGGVRARLLLYATPGARPVGALLACLVTLALSVSGGVSVAAAESNDADYQTLRSKVRYVAENSLGRCREKWPSLRDSKSVGKPVGNCLPLADIESIDVAGDEVSMPAAYVARTLKEGTIQAAASNVVVQPLQAQLRFRDGRCIELIYPRGLDGKILNRIQIDGVPISVPPIVGVEAKCKASLAAIKSGVTTRADFEKHFSVDGGISVPFRCERFVFKNGIVGAQVLKINVAFRPAAATKKESHPKQSPNDIYIRCSPVYLEPAYFD